MILVRNKLKLMGFVLAFLFFLTLLLGFIYGHRRIPGIRKFSDNHFKTNLVELRAGKVYRFSCDFTDEVFFLDNLAFKINTPLEFSIICDKRVKFNFRHTDKMEKFFSYFWSKDFVVYEDSVSYTNYRLFKNSIYTYYGEDNFKSELSNNFIKKE